ncbi:thioesterase domain-containing protein, partial [Streptomyces sp. URMC 123]|uniref:thioesterase domain-containing protein n=1 Tax=Streptomyces sp. URMC 123 TaxID=3423403 RepID=UPI003F1A156F
TEPAPVPTAGPAPESEPKNAAVQAPWWAYADSLRPAPRPWPECANDPLARRREGLLLPRLRAALEAGPLPPHLVPDEIVLTDSLPLTRHGRPDATALPAPDRPARDTAGAFVAPRDGTELRICRVWEDVLGVRPVGVTDNFFALGGHSLLAMRVISRLQRRFDQDIDLAVLFGRPTVAELADVLRPGTGRGARSSLVALREGGGRPPFLAVHQTGMNTLVYQFLADELGPQQPFHMLEHSDIGQFERLEDLAAHYVTAVRQAFPHGPYRLGGLSFGGLVAFEMAQQLVAAGEEVDVLTLFESSLPGTPPDRGGPRELLAYRTHHYARVFELIFHRSVRLSEQELLPLDEQGQLDLLHQRVAEVLDGDIGVDLFRATVEAVRTARAMMRGYRPAPWDGPLHLFLGREPMPEGINDPEFYRPDRALGWDAVAPRLEIVDVPGDHLTLLNPPNVEVLARHLRPLLEGRATGGPR